MNNITDQNFKEEISKIKKLVVVDFFANWCPPCREMAPAIEKVAKEYEDEFVLIKVDIDNMPNTANLFKVTGVPFVALMKEGEMIDSFLGSRGEEELREWFKKSSSNDSGFVCRDSIMDYEDYAENNDYMLNPNKKLVDGIVAGLLRNEELHGERYCPCRRVTGDKQEDKNIVCPCTYHREEIENDGKCMCGLFVRS